MLRRNVEYHLEVSDVLGRASSDAALESEQSDPQGYRRTIKLLKDAV